ncbi:hypothetical protein F511_31450 [Dorcoceras hygrometricum]|uniref:Uncharacterized protein n=1 Tax=Dorcoceras hygrometricum TaxID=472368 RepID=A0A2Z7B2M2_9LAMI|nr:hypothetical protein F511_31450 [Dorcoceras hygrometricum]
MSLFDLQDVCMVIGSLATLDLPMFVDLIGIYVLKGPYCTLTMTDWFLKALSVIPRGSWGDVARRFTMIRWYWLLDFRTEIELNLLSIGGGRMEVRLPKFNRDRQRDHDFSRGPDSENDNRQPLKCQFPREIGRSQAPRCQQGTNLKHPMDVYCSYCYVLTVPDSKLLNLPLRPGSGIRIRRCANTVRHYEPSGSLPRLISRATTGYHGFSVARGVDPAGNAPGGG